MKADKQKLILIVEDNPMNAEILKECLQEDYELEIVENGYDALEIAPRIKPDLILLDVMMPGIDGYETCRRLRSIPELEGINIVMISAKAMEIDSARGLESGADKYITKPFDEKELLEELSPYL